MPNPKVSVIVTTRNEQEVVERLLKSITDQTYANVEIIVVDNRSSDKTKEIAKKYTQNVFDKGPERSAQRNFGAKMSTGRYLLFLDADMELSSDVVKECVDKMELEVGLGAIAIPETPVADTFWEKVKAFEREFYNLEGDADIDAARFFTKTAFEEVDGYDVNITGPEDWDLPERVKKQGYDIERISSRIKHFERVPSPFKLAHKKYYYALKSHRYLEKHDISAVSAKTIYVLRPVFYRNWKKLLLHPILSIAMFFMLTLEQFGGGLGYVVGKMRKL